MYTKLTKTKVIRKVKQKKCKVEKMVDTNLEYIRQNYPQLSESFLYSLCASVEFVQLKF